VNPLGIQVLIVEPGEFRTGFANPAALTIGSAIPDYADTVGPIRDGLPASDQKQTGDPDKAAAAVLAEPLAGHLGAGGWAKLTAVGVVDMVEIRSDDGAMFDLDQLITDCQGALADVEPRLAIKEVLTRAVARPNEVLDALAPEAAGFTLLHHTRDLTILNIVWAPKMQLYPHDHRMWAVIGIYSGQEDNVFYRRSGRGDRTLTESGGKHLASGEVVVLADDTIHGVTNPRDYLTGAIHVYGGDFVNQPRSQWGPGPQLEQRYDIGQARKQFAQANEAWLRLRPERPGRDAPKADA